MEASTKPSAEQVERDRRAARPGDLRAARRAFRDKALIADESDTRRPRATPRRGGPKQAEALDWFERWDTVLDESEAPFYKWFIGGKLNASYNALDRHVEAGRGDRVAFHWRGEEGEERDVTYAELLRDVKRLANVLKERGVEPGDVVGIYLPMIPEVAVAMLACARIGAPHNVVFGGFSPDAVKERMEFSEAKALITVDQARRKGKAADIKPAVDEFLDDALDRDRGGGAQHRRRRADEEGATSSTTRRSRPPRGLPGRAARRRAPAVRALHERLDRQAEGHPAHHRRLPHRRGLDDEARVRPQARRGRVLVLGRRRLGHRPLLHRLRAADERDDLGDVRGRARLPAQGTSGGSCASATA